MPSAIVIVPAQVRAGRALLGWSQGRLSEEAKVGLSSIRDIESEKGPTDSPVVHEIQRALENGGVVFVGGSAKGGPGVSLVDNRPTIIRRPVVTKWEGLPFDIEWEGKPVTVWVLPEALEELGLSGNVSDENLLRGFDAHRGRILDVVVGAMLNPGNFDKHGHLRLRAQHFVPNPEHSAAGGFALESKAQALPAQWTRVRLRPLPIRIWRGERQENIDDSWIVEQVLPGKGRIDIANPATGHSLPLYSAHIAEIIPDPEESKPAAPAVLLKLTVQIIFEDGHARREPLWQ